MNNLLDDIPSIPKIPSVAPLHLGITTRVMAKTLALQREREKELGKNAKENTKTENEVRSRRRSSRFLEGAAVPNSVIRSDLQGLELPTKDGESTKKERDEFVEKIIKRLQPQKKMYHSIYDEDVDREALNKIKKELQRRSLLPLTREKEEDKKSLSIATGSTSKSIKDPWEELKEKRRISRRTSILAPLGGERRSTYESIKKAIQNSKIIQQLLDIDNIEEQKIKQMQTGKSLMPSTELKETVADKQPVTEKLTVPENVKRFKKDGKGKERKGSKRKSSLKSEKSLSVTAAEKPSVKTKTSNDSRRFSKQSTAKSLKEELEKQSSTIINNTSQHRKNTH